MIEDILVHLDGHYLLYVIYFSIVASIGFVVGGIFHQFVTSSLYTVLFLFLLSDITARLPFLESPYLLPVYVGFFLTGLCCRLSSFTSVISRLSDLTRTIVELVKRSLSAVLSLRNTKARAQTENSSQGRRDRKEKQNQSRASGGGSAEDAQTQREQAKEEFRRARESRDGGESKRDTRTAEQIMGLNGDFSRQDLETKMKRLRSKYSPDNYEHFNSEEITNKFTEEMACINVAYNELKKRF